MIWPTTEKVFNISKFQLQINMAKTEHLSFYKFSLYYVYIKQQKIKHLSGTSYLSKKKRRKKRQHTKLIYQTSSIGKVCLQYKENITQHFF